MSATQFYKERNGIWYVGFHDEAGEEHVLLALRERDGVVTLAENDWEPMLGVDVPRYILPALQAALQAISGARA